MGVAVFQYKFIHKHRLLAALGSQSIDCQFPLGPSLYVHCSLPYSQRLAQSRCCTYSQGFILTQTLEGGYCYLHL